MFRTIGSQFFVYHWWGRELNLTVLCGPHGRSFKGTVGTDETMLVNGQGAEMMGKDKQLRGSRLKVITDRSNI